MKAMICFTHPAWVHQFHHIIWRMRERGDEVLCLSLIHISETTIH